MIKYQQGDVIFTSINSSDIDFVTEHIDEFQREIKSLRKKTKSLPEGNWEHTYKNKETNFVDSTGNGSLTVAYGEVTGHSHRFDMSTHLPGLQITAFGSTNISSNIGSIPNFVEIKGGPATITHEEHKALEIPEGLYKVKIVREYDHIAGRSSWVVD